MKQFERNSRGSGSGLIFISTAFRIINPSLVLAVLLMSPFMTASADQALEKVQNFHGLYLDGDYARVAENCQEFLSLYPEDTIIQRESAHACFWTADFKTVLSIADQSQYLPYLHDIKKIDQISIYGMWDEYAIWQLQILAYTALNDPRALAELRSLCEIDRADPIYTFLLYLLTLYSGDTRTAGSIRKTMVLKAADDENGLSNECEVLRLLPVLDDPDILESRLETALSREEYSRLLACAGVRYCMDGEREKGLKLLERAVLEEDFQQYSVVLALFALVSRDMEKTRSLALTQLAKPAFRELSQLNEQLVEAFYSKPDYKKAVKITERIKSVDPLAIELYYSCKIFLYMLLDNWEEVGKLTTEFLDKDPWNSEPALCIKVYYPLFLLVLNDQEGYEQAAEALAGQELPGEWKIYASLVKDPAQYDRLSAVMKEKYVTLFVMGLFSETQGEFISAEEFYVKMIKKEMFYIAETIVAEARLQIISPLAAIQRITSQGGPIFRSGEDPE